MTQLNLSQLKLAKQQGFTLIELIAVIVILGILAATAIPKFVSVSSDARIAKLNAGVAALKSASSMGHAKFLANTAAVSYVAEGSTINLINEYPTAANIILAAGLSAIDYPNAVAGTVMTITLQTNCTATYTQATVAAGVVTPPIFATVTTGC